MSDLVERLNGIGDTIIEQGYAVMGTNVKEAATEIQRLQARVEGLEKVAEIARFIHGWHGGFEPEWGDLEQALAALKVTP